MSAAAGEGIGAPSLPRFPRDALVQNGIALLTLVLVAVPLIPIIYQSFVDRPLYDPGQQWTLANFSKLASSETFREALLNTVIFAVLSTVVAQVVGLFTAILVARTDVPGRGFFGSALVWPLFLSHLVTAFGWTIMYGPSGYVTGLVAQVTGIQHPWNLYTIPGLSIVAGVATAPLTFLYCLASANSQDPALEDAARTVGAGPFRVILSISLPLLRPALVFSTVQNFVIALESLSIPLLLGGPVGLRFFTTFIYDEGLNATVTDYGLGGGRGGGAAGDGDRADRWCRTGCCGTRNASSRWAARPRASASCGWAGCAGRPSCSWRCTSCSSWWPSRRAC